MIAAPVRGKAAISTAATAAAAFWGTAGCFPGCAAPGAAAAAAAKFIAMSGPAIRPPAAIRATNATESSRDHAGIAAWARANACWLHCMAITTAPPPTADRGGPFLDIATIAADLRAAVAAGAARAVAARCRMGPISITTVLLHLRAHRHRTRSRPTFAMRTGTLPARSPSRVSQFITPSSRRAASWGSGRSSARQGQASWPSGRRHKIARWAAEFARRTISVSQGSVGKTATRAKSKRQRGQSQELRCESGGGRIERGIPAMIRS